jgi:hypothetical protein
MSASVSGAIRGITSSNATRADSSPAAGRPAAWRDQVRERGYPGPFGAAMNCSRRRTSC